MDVILFGRRRNGGRDHRPPEDPQVATGDIFRRHLGRHAARQARQELHGLSARWCRIRSCATSSLATRREDAAKGALLDGFPYGRPGGSSRNGSTPRPEDRRRDLARRRRQGARGALAAPHLRTTARPTTRGDSPPARRICDAWRASRPATTTRKATIRGSTRTATRPSRCRLDGGPDPDHRRQQPIGGRKQILEALDALVSIDVRFAPGLGIAVKQSVELAVMREAGRRLAVAISRDAVAGISTPTSTAWPPSDHGAGRPRLSRLRRRPTPYPRPSARP